MSAARNAPVEALWVAAARARQLWRALDDLRVLDAAAVAPVLTTEDRRIVLDAQLRLRNFLSVLDTASARAEGEGRTAVHDRTVDEDGNRATWDSEDRVTLTALGAAQAEGSL